MAKPDIRYVCRSCGRVSARLMGRCPQCGEYDSMDEEILAPEPSVGNKKIQRGLSMQSKPIRLGDIEGGVDDRIPLSIGEFSRVLGGGIVPGSIVLVGGDPGIGKSTLLLQMTLEMAKNKEYGRVLYVSGEESEKQIKMRALRLLSEQESALKNLPENLFLVTETNLDMILQHIAAVKPDLVIIDSIQTVYIPEVTSSAGSVTQVRECSSTFKRTGKIQWYCCFCDWSRNQRGCYSRTTGFGTYSRYSLISGRGSLSGFSFIKISQESVWPNLGSRCI